MSDFWRVCSLQWAGKSESITGFQSELAVLLLGANKVIVVDSLPENSREFVKNGGAVLKQRGDSHRILYTPNWMVPAVLPGLARIRDLTLGLSCSDSSRAVYDGCGGLRPDVLKKVVNGRHLIGFARPKYDDFTARLAMLAGEKEALESVRSKRKSYLRESGDDESTMRPHSIIVETAEQAARDIKLEENVEAAYALLHMYHPRVSVDSSKDTAHQLRREELRKKYHQLQTWSEPSSSLLDALAANFESLSARDIKAGMRRALMIGVVSKNTPSQPLVSKFYEENFAHDAPLGELKNEARFKECVVRLSAVLPARAYLRMCDRKLTLKEFTQIEADIASKIRLYCNPHNFNKDPSSFESQAYELVKREFEDISSHVGLNAETLCASLSKLQQDRNHFLPKENNWLNDDDKIKSLLAAIYAYAISYRQGDGETGDGETGDGKTGDGKTGDRETGDGETSLRDGGVSSSSSRRPLPEAPISDWIEFFLDHCMESGEPKLKKFALTLFSIYSGLSVCLYHRASPWPPNSSSTCELDMETETETGCLSIKECPTQQQNHYIIGSKEFPLIFLTENHQRQEKQSGSRISYSANDWSPVGREVLHILVNRLSQGSKQQQQFDLDGNKNPSHQLLMTAMNKLSVPLLSKIHLDSLLPKTGKRGFANVIDIESFVFNSKTKQGTSSHLVENGLKGVDLLKEPGFHIKPAYSLSRVSADTNKGIRLDQWIDESAKNPFINN